MQDPSLIAIATVSCATVAALVGSQGAASAGTVPPSACDTSWKAPVAGSFWSAANWTHGGPGGQRACLPASGTPYSVSVTGPGGQVSSLAIGAGVTLDVQAAPDGGTRLVATSGIGNDGTITLNQHAPTTGVDILTAGAGGLVNDGLIEVEQSTVDIDAIDNTSGYLDVMQDATLNLGARYEPHRQRAQWRHLPDRRHIASAGRVREVARPRRTPSRRCVCQ